MPMLNTVMTVKTVIIMTLSITDIDDDNAINDCVNNKNISYNIDNIDNINKFIDNSDLLLMRMIIADNISNDNAMIISAMLIAAEVIMAML